MDVDTTLGEVSVSILPCTLISHQYSQFDMGHMNRIFWFFELGLYPNSIFFDEAMQEIPIVVAF